MDVRRQVCSVLGCASGKRYGVLIALLGMLVLAPVTASASHYDLSSIDLVDEEMTGRMGSVGIRTTEDLWKATAPGKPAARAARVLKVSRRQIAQWHDFCDLLRLNGIGPKVARVLTAGGVPRLAILARQDVDELNEKIRKVNLELEILGITPDKETVRAWIDQAGNLTLGKAGSGKRK
jgi:predicted flap endonuclease-1-like 5' DNA nuclease